MTSIRVLVTTAFLALTSILGSTASAVADEPAPAGPTHGTTQLEPGASIVLPGGVVVTAPLLPAGSIPIGKGPTAFADWGYSWSGMAWVKFSESETIGIVQAGIAGATTYAAYISPEPITKVALAMAGVGVFLTARQAHESASEKCVMVYVAWWAGLQMEAIPC